MRSYIHYPYILHVPCVLLASTLTVVARCRCAARCPDASTSQLSHSDTPATNSQRPFRRRAPQQLPLPKMIDPGGSPDVAPAAAELEDLRLLPGGKPLSRSASPCPPPQTEAAAGRPPTPRTTPGQRPRTCRRCRSSGRGNTAPSRRRRVGAPASASLPPASSSCGPSLGTLAASTAGR